MCQNVTLMYVTLAAQDLIDNHSLKGYILVLLWARRLRVWSLAKTLSAKGLSSKDQINAVVGPLGVGLCDYR